MWEPNRRHIVTAIMGAALPTTRLRATVAARLPRILLRTAPGEIEIELEMARAPITAANFLRYVDLGLLDRGRFYRVVRPDNDHNPAGIRVVQGGLDTNVGALPPIPHEGTSVTGLHNTDGVLSMARDAPGTATAEFSISIGDNPALDQGGLRNPDQQGFAAFGRVVRGMAVVRRINGLRADAVVDDPYLAGQMLNPVIPFLSVRRLHN